MKKFWLIFIFAFLKLNAQTYSLTGKVTDVNNNPLENITVSLMKQKDSELSITLEQVKAETSASKFLHKMKLHFYRFREIN